MAVLPTTQPGAGYQPAAIPACALPHAPAAEPSDPALTCTACTLPASCGDPGTRQHVQCAHGSLHMLQVTPLTTSMYKLSSEPAEAFMTGAGAQDGTQPCWPGRVHSSGRLLVRTAFARMLWLECARTGQMPLADLTLFASRSSEVRGSLLAQRNM